MSRGTGLATQNVHPDSFWIHDTVLNVYLTGLDLNVPEIDYCECSAITIKGS